MLPRAPRSGAPIQIQGVSHWYGAGELRRQILFDVSATIQSGEIVILSGPSGSGKTTLLTLIGALRSTQAGSLRVLGHELCGAPRETLAGVRRRVGYVFQAHNLLGALTVQQNVRMGLALDSRWEQSGGSDRIAELLSEVGLEGFGSHLPSQLSGGQRQRVAIARALASEPRIILADEPTASLDGETGRQIATLLERVAREQGVTVVLVTHDNRILDVADRILALEDGQLESFMAAVTEETRHLWGVLAHELQQGSLVRRVRDLEPRRFAQLLDQVTQETRELLAMVELAQSQTFGSVLSQVLEAFALKSGETLEADATRVYLLDALRGALYTLRSGDAESGLQTQYVPAGTSIARRVADSGERLCAFPVQHCSDFSPEVDLGPDQGIEHLLAIPLLDSQDRVLAVIELGQKSEREGFDAKSEAGLDALCRSLATVLEFWLRMSRVCSHPGAEGPGGAED